MSHLRRNLLFSNRIITRRYPVLDKPTHVFDWGWFYENGTYEYYSLFSYEKSIIRSFKNLFLFNQAVHIVTKSARTNSLVQEFFYFSMLDI